jgi:hypothetical protein
VAAEAAPRRTTLPLKVRQARAAGAEVARALARVLETALQVFRNDAVQERLLRAAL